MGSYQQRGKRSFLLVAETGSGPRGRGRVTKTIRIEDDALLKTTRKLEQYLQTELAKFQMEVDSGQYVKTEKMLFKTFVEEHWLKKFVMKNLEETTQLNYLYHTKKRILPFFGEMRIDSIKTMHCVDFLDDLAENGPGQATLVYNYRVLKSIFRWAKEWKIINTEPMAGVPKPKENTPEMQYYDEQEISQLIEALQSEEIHFKVIITLAFTTGMRRGELLGLEWKHLDLDRGIIDVRQTLPLFKERQPIFKGPKRKSSIRKISIPASVVEELRQFEDFKKRERMNSKLPWRGDGRFLLFCRPDGWPYYPKIWGDRWREFHREKLPNLKYIRFHDLRHTSASLLISQGVHARIIYSRLGHSKISTTMNVYGHVIESVDRAAADSLDSLFMNTNSKKSIKTP